MKSMTGFSEASLNKDGIQFKCLVKSLNSRFIEVNVKLPNNLKKFEGWIRDYTKKNFARGKIDIDIYYTSPPKEHLKISDNFIELVKKNEKNAVKKGLELGSSSYLDLLRLRDSIQDDYMLNENSLKSLVKTSLMKLKKTRLVEGKSIKNDMNKLIATMNRSIKKVNKMEKLNIKHIQKKFKRIKSEIELSNKDLNLNEVFSAFNKADINEEVVRFSSHLELVSKLINSKDIIGKKLDFYSQEMLREINTLSSKAMIPEIKNEAVELKSSIEKVKEHAQNVE
ncbi:MAG: hypothetical protein CMQ58_02205 [Gammaproteobacteria bacterium]|nr:hypothetical protein [Gammaproteobacteria bacterium]|tara:strand:+ start:569 stop:1414 length:846 start_codon:yes stop_codon:yes gene_type:complete